MINLRDVSIITHIRLDSPARLDNILMRNAMMKSLSKNAEFIVIEDDDRHKVERHLDKDIVYEFLNNSGPHQKNTAYNIGAAMSSRKYLVFLDADCIIHPKIIQKLAKGDQSVFKGLVYPYNRFALYLTALGKRVLKKEFKYESLERLSPEQKLTHGLSNTLGHLYGNCPGGSYMMTPKFFDSVNGFNPNFIGWGYEDTEFLTRMQLLEHPIHQVSGDDNLLFHLHHGDPNKSDTAARGEHLQTISTMSNKVIYEDVAKMSKKEVQEYCKTWTR